MLPMNSRRLTGQLSRDAAKLRRASRLPELLPRANQLAWALQVPRTSDESYFDRRRRFGASPVTFADVLAVFAAILVVPFRLWPSPKLRASSERWAE